MSLVNEQNTVSGCILSSPTNSPTSTPIINEEETERVDILEIGEEYHGSPLNDKRPGIIRLGFININSLPKMKGAAKYDAIRNSIAASEVDILGIAEPNKCWHLLEPEHTWKEVSKTWWRDSNSSIAYNSFDIGATKIYQPGGSITTAIEQMAHRVLTRCTVIKINQKRA